MKNLEKLSEELLMQTAGHLHMEDMAAELAQYKNLPPLNRPQLDDKLIRAIEQHKAEQRKATQSKALKRGFKQVAAVFIVAATFFTSLFATVDAFRLQMLNYLGITSESGDQVRYSNIFTLSDVMEAGFIYCPLEIPIGFSLESIASHRTRPILYFSDTNRNLIVFQQIAASQYVILDNEVEVSKALLAQGRYKANIVERNGEFRATWTNDEFVFVVSWNTMVDDSFDFQRFADSVGKIV